MKSLFQEANSQWVCFNDIVNAMIYLLIALSISKSIHLSVHMQLVSLLQWHLSSMQWSTSTLLYSSVNRSILSFCSTSESVTKMLSMQWFIYSHRTFILHSESATIDILILHKTKKIHSYKHELLKKRSNVTILATHLHW